MRVQLAARIGIGYGVAIAALLLVLGISLAAFEMARRETRYVRESVTPTIGLLSNMLLSLEDMENAEFLYFAPGQDLALQMRRFDEAELQFQQRYLAAELAVHSERSEEILAAVGRHFGAFVHVDERMRTLLTQGRLQEAQALNLTDSIQAADAMRDGIRELRQRNLDNILRSQDREARILTLAEILAVSVSAVGAVLAALMWWKTSRGIVDPLLALREAAGAIATGRFVRASHPAAPLTREIEELERGFNHMASQLQESTEHLEAQVAERTARLERMVEELESLDKLKSDLMDVVSHELLTPINFITGFGSALEDEVMGPLTDEQRVAVRRMLEGAHRLTRMVRNMLDFTKLESGRLGIFPEEVDYGALAQDVAEGLRPIIQSKDQVFVVDIAPELPLVVADPSHLSHVLEELLDNASKFSSERARIELRIRPRNGSVLTEVSDTGVGIPSDLVPRLLQGYYQADLTSTRRFGGLGLGLAVADRLIRQMGGVLTIESQIGRGTTVRFTLPSSDARVLN